MPTGYDTRALGNATAALAGLEVYASPTIPRWNPSIFVAGMTSGVIYRVPLNASSAAPLTYFKAEDRYRDLAVSPDGRRIYVVTDAHGRTVDGVGRDDGGRLAHPGALLEFTYTGTRTNQPR